MAELTSSRLALCAGLARSGGLLLLVVLAILLLARAALADRPRVVDVRLDSQTQRTVVALMVDAPVDFRVFTLPDPYRLVIDLPAVDWRTPQSQLQRAARQSGLVEGVRYGQFRGGTLRIVFDLTRPVAVERVGLEAHGRHQALTLRWRPASGYRSQRFGDFREAPIPRPRPGARREPPTPPLIVIDPGHGGIDPGAIGRRNTMEKHITLAVSRQLARALKGTGRYRVALTRADDRFLALRERMGFARQLDADLFLSIHADSAVNPKAQGLSVYTLSGQASDAEAAALARQENKADVIGGFDLTDEQADVVSILINLAQRETRNQSVRFANQLVQTMVLRVPVLERPHRQAGFAVLKAPDVPAALIELGFLSHPEEERLLLSDGHRRAIVAGIVAAVDAFFANRVGSFAATGG